MEAKPFIVCAQQRSGTTVLQRTLNESPFVRSLGEVFHALRIEEKDSYFNFKQNLLKEKVQLSLPSLQNQEVLFNQYLEFLAQSVSERFFLMDIKYNSWHHFNSFWHGPLEIPFALELAMKNQVKIIHVIRKNVFLQYLSSQIAIRREKWHYSPEEKVEEEGKIVIDKYECEKAMTLSLEHSRLFTKWLKSYPYTIRLIYEDLFDEDKFSERSIDRINKIFGQDIEMPNKPKLKKIVSAPRKNVANAKELLDFFSGTQFQDLVESALY